MFSRDIYNDPTLGNKVNKCITQDGELFRYIRLMLCDVVVVLCSFNKLTILRTVQE